MTDFVRNFYLKRMVSTNRTEDKVADGKPMDKLETISLGVFQAIFNYKSTVTVEGEDYRVNITRTRLRNVTYEGIFFIEQNPQKSSKYAQMAQQGHQIMWGIQGRTFILRVIDGEFKKLR